MHSEGVVVMEPQEMESDEGMELGGISAAAVDSAAEVVDNVAEVLEEESGVEKIVGNRIEQGAIRVIATETLAATLADCKTRRPVPLGVPRTAGHRETVRLLRTRVVV